ncbi:hypothetical protein GCM10022403_096430 [Streptomyces coacervatus]|uniref:Uncharacterized protein n=1 Tax=Streptomyces coacervatus TaxID=647381 RepID=A0ABP7JP12_9ACTN
MRGSGGVQDPLGDGGLAGVDVGEDAEVADDGEGVEVGAHGPLAFLVIVRSELGCAIPGLYGSDHGTPVMTAGRVASDVRHGHPVPAAQRAPDKGGHEDHLVLCAGDDDLGAVTHSRPPLARPGVTATPGAWRV